MNGQRIIGIVYNKAGRAAVRLFYVLFLEIVNLNLVVVPAFGIITGESSGFLKDAVRQFVVAGFYDDVGAGHSFGVKPPVVAGGKFKRQFLVLVIVLPDIDVIPVGGAVVERLALTLGLLVGALPADIAVFDQLFLDLHEIVFRECNIERGCDALQVFDLGARLRGQIREGFIRAL